MITAGLLMLTAGTLQWHLPSGAGVWAQVDPGAALQPGWSPKSCKVVGFSLNTKQLPQKIPNGDKAALKLRTLPGQAGYDPLPSLEATAAACRSNPECVMFTSDGYLLSVYRTPASVASVNEQIKKERQGTGALAWAPMDFCSGFCCGTWVADGLLQQLLTPASGRPEAADSIGSPGEGTTCPNDNVFMDPNKMGPFCSKQSGAQTLQWMQQLAQATNVTLPPFKGGPRGVGEKCTQRCRVACCARFAAGISDFDKYYFNQCTDSCGYGCGILPPGPQYGCAFSTAAAVLKMQYLRAANVVPGQQGVRSPPAIAVKLIGDRKALAGGAGSLNRRLLHRP